MKKVKKKVLWIIGIIVIVVLGWLGVVFINESRTVALYAPMNYSENRRHIDEINAYFYAFKEKDITKSELTTLMYQTISINGYYQSGFDIAEKVHINFRDIEGNTITTDPNSVIELIKNREVNVKDYQVSFEYDKEGYINLINIVDLKKELNK